MMPTSLSQIIEQIFVAVFALVMSSMMIRIHASEALQRCKDGEPPEQPWEPEPESFRP